MRKRTVMILLICVEVIVLLLAILAAMYFIFQVPFFDRGGWHESNSGQRQYWDYYGKPLTAWQTIEGSTYYFAPEDGAMCTGWLELEEGRYYLDENGAMHTGWLDTAQGRYYMDESGIMHTGWLETAEGRYYLNETGVMYTGWLDTAEGRYYLGVDGVMYTGWADIAENRYYLGETGLLQTGWLTLGQSRYYLGDTGSVSTGWVETPEGKIHLREDGSVYTGWLDLEGNSYLLGEDGILVTGWVIEENLRYYLREDGSRAQGFVGVDGVTRYFTSTGEYIPLVNRWNPVPEDYTDNLVEIDGFQVDALCRDALVQMMDGCEAAGYECRINSAYRSLDMQQDIWDERYALYIEAGYSQKTANTEVGKSVAVPGTSEHHLGLAVDVGGSEGLYEWLADHSWEYGFIMRYPDNKMKITGIIYEPWHFRYVGKELAEDIYRSGLCLEEYLNALEKKAAA